MNKTTAILFTTLVLLTPVFSHAIGTRIVPVAAYAQNSINDTRCPARAIDGSGLNSLEEHDNNQNNMWMSAKGGATWFLVDLGSVQSLASFKIWNYNQENYSNRGIKQADLFVSSSASVSTTDPGFSAPDFSGDSTWTLALENFTLARSSAQSGYPGCAPVSLPTPLLARWVGIRIDSIFSTDSYGTYCGISEIYFYHPENGLFFNGVSEASTTSATLSGELSTHEASAPVYVAYGTTDGIDDTNAWDSIVPLGSQPNGVFSATLTGLTPDTSYYTAFYAILDNESVWTESSVFQTGVVSVQSPGDIYESEPGSHSIVFSRPASCAAEPITVSYALSGTAVSGTDYAAVPGTVSFAAGVTSASVAFSVIDDSANDGDLAVTVTVLPGPYAANDTSSVTFSLLDDEALVPADCVWNSASDGSSWHDSQNWQSGSIPRIVDTVYAYTAVPGDGITVAAPAYAKEIKAKAVNWSVSTNLTVATKILFGTDSGNSGNIRQTGGVIRAHEVWLGNANNNTFALDVSGTGTVFSATTMNTCRYNGNSARATVDIHDGAELRGDTFFMSREGGASNRGPAQSWLNLYDGGTATFGILYFASGGYGHVSVSNATLNVTDTLYGNSGGMAVGPSGIDVYDGGRVNVHAILFSQYTSSNEYMTQWPGSTVHVGEFIKLSGAGHGGTGSSTNIVYTVRGGVLDVVDGVSVGANGQAEMRLEGGTTIIHKNFSLDNVWDLTANVVLTNENQSVVTNTVVTRRYAPSLLRIANDAVFSLPNGIFRLYGWSRGGRIALELEGGEFEASVQTIEASAVEKAHGFTIRPIVTETGLAPFRVTGDVNLLDNTVVVDPSIMGNAPRGIYTLLAWNGALTGSSETPFVLSEDADSAQWRLDVDRENKRVLLRYTPPRTVILLF